MQDKQIVDLYWQRDEDALRHTEQKYGAYLFRTAYNILANAEDSKECVNDTYLKAWHSMPTQRPSVLSTYLGRITRQSAIDVFRRQHSKRRYASQYALSLDELADSFSCGDDAASQLDAALLAAAISDFLRTLPQDARRAFVGRYYFFDSLSELADYCGIKKSTLKSLLYRSRQKLSAHLKKEGFEL